MPKYKGLIEAAGITHRTLADRMHTHDKRIDKAMLSKFVTYACVPTPIQLDAICEELGCGVLDIYAPDELAYIKEEAIAAPAKKERECAARRSPAVLNLTVEVSREIAERVFSPESLKLLGLRNKTEYIRACLATLDERLAHLRAKK